MKSSVGRSDVLRPAFFPWILVNFMSISPSILRRCLILPLASALVAAVGCGGSSGTLKGTVSYKNKPLKGGNILLLPVGGGTSFSGSIENDGTYKIENVKAGKYKVCVETDSLKASTQQSSMAMGPGGRPPVAKAEKNEPPPGAAVPEGYKMSGPPAQRAKENLARYVQIPPGYADPEQTTLTLEFKGGNQDYPINLE